MPMNPKFDVVKFAEDFIPDRIRFFEKEMTVCLRTLRRKKFGKPTHAYFPALMVCIANLDLMGQIYTGHDRAGIEGVRIFVRKYMDETTYTDLAVDLLWKGFRNKVAHLAHPEYVIDTARLRNWNHPHMRVTWFVSQTPDLNHLGRNCSHLLVRKKKKQIKSEPRPYNVAFDHIFYISLPIFQNNIQSGMAAHLTALKEDGALQRNFERIVRNLFPM